MDNDKLNKCIKNSEEFIFGLQRMKIIEKCSICPTML